MSEIPLDLIIRVIDIVSKAGLSEVAKKAVDSFFDSLKNKTGRKDTYQNIDWGKVLREDKEFAIEVKKIINEDINFKSQFEKISNYTGNTGYQSGGISLGTNVGNIYYSENKNNEVNKKIKNDYQPDIAPEPTRDFINRETEQKILIESLKKINIIVIQGIAGIGKTELAAKIRQNLKNKYIIYWKEISDSDNFDSIVHNLAGFLNENNDNILFQYLEENSNDFNSIEKYITNSLNSNYYVLFFDNYHKVTDEKIHTLFSRLKENLKNSTIILTTRVTPDFINPVDKIQNKILDENLEGFDLPTTQEYFSNKGISLSQEQLNKINEKIWGHPLALLLFFANLTENDDININASLEDLPKDNIEMYLWKEVFSKLSLEEREILDYISVFRKEIKSDTLSLIINKEKVKDNLFILENKLLVKRKKNLYYLHDSLREFCYGLIESPKRKKIHQNIGDYYKSQERTKENLVEASHHLIKNYGIINEEIIDYFLSMPNDTYSFFIINEILKQNKIKTIKIFELFNKFIASNNIQMTKAFILSYGYYFEDIYMMDNERSFQIYHKILQSYTDSGILDAISQSVKEIAHKHPSESLQIWKEVLNLNNYLERAVVIYMCDLNINSYDYILFFKDILHQTSNESVKELITRKFEKWGITDYQRISIADHLDKIRCLGINESINYIESNYKIMDAHFATQILSEMIKHNKTKSLELYKNIIEYHKESSNMTPFQVSDILSNSIEKEDLAVINEFFLKKENDKFALLVGIRTLDLLSKKFESDVIFRYLDPLLNHENTTIRKIAVITKKGIIEKSQVGQKIRKEYNSFFQILKICVRPDKIASMFKTEFRPSAPFVTTVWIWGTIKVIEDYDIDEIIDASLSVLDSNNSIVEDAGRWASIKVQTDPEFITDFIYKQPC